MIEKGDTVRFIDEALEGTVVSLTGKDMATVLTNDGFSRVAALSQLVKVKVDNEKENLTRRPIPPPVKQQEAPERTKTRGKIFSFNEAALKEEIIYAAFELIEPASPLTSAVQLYLINNSDFTIAFSLSRKMEMRDEGIAIDKMEPRTIRSFLTYTQNELALFECFRVQIIFYPSGKKVFRPPLQKQFKFNVNELLESQDFISKMTDCQFIPVADLIQSPEIDITPLVNKFSEEMKGDEQINEPLRRKATRTSKTIIYTNEKTVDLHIEELIKDYTTMSNGQIIAHQLKHFQFEMDQAILNHLSRITFIHGVGAGVLRSAIREELKKFPNIRFSDAPAEKFGYGATEIVFI